MAQANRYDKQSKADVKVFGKTKDRATQLDKEYTYDCFKKLT